MNNKLEFYRNLVLGFIMIIIGVQAIFISGGFLYEKRNFWIIILLSIVAIISIFDNVEKIKKKDKKVIFLFLLFTNIFYLFSLLYCYIF